MQWWACDTIVPTICGMMNSSTQKDAWHFTDNRVVRAACQFGYWLPSDPEAAPVPTAEQCMSTIATMKDYAQKASTWYAATINLNAYPGPELTNALVQCELPSGSGTGVAVSSGYPSYILTISSTSYQGGTAGAKG